ncbi:MAG: peptidylprolyl isomerase, partial [Bacteroidota bacterium]|nr:peptidylprolyl isomerase [Bacteroidota bacterium]
MRFIYFFIFLFMGCQNIKSVPKKTLIKKTQNPEYYSEISQHPLEAPFLLNDENVMEFFLDYDKQYKENKVRISTDYGNIDISL